MNTRLNTATVAYYTGTTPGSTACFVCDNITTQYPSCDDGSVGSAVLNDSRLNTSTVAYYSGTTTASRACFVCGNITGYALNTTTSERFCQSDGTWSGLGSRW